MSSGEAEFIAMVKAASECMGLVISMGDLGWQASLKVWVDISAAKSMDSRVGLGRVGHMEVKLMWPQETVRKKQLAAGKVRGNLNTADEDTHPAQGRRGKGEVDIQCREKEQGELSGRREEGEGGLS
jgi:hypothetical protein